MSRSPTAWPQEAPSKHACDAVYNVAGAAKGLPRSRQYGIRIAVLSNCQCSGPIVSTIRQFISTYASQTALLARSILQQALYAVRLFIISRKQFMMKASNPRATFQESPCAVRLFIVPEDRCMTSARSTSEKANMQYGQYAVHQLCFGYSRTWSLRGLVGAVGWAAIRGTRNGHHRCIAQRATRSR